MGIFDGLEKLINEHGSAVILKERINLANDKYAALEQRVVSLEQNIVSLEAEKAVLRSSLNEAQNEVQHLKKLSEKAHSNRLEEVKEKILALLATQDNFENNIAQSLGISAQVAKFHLQDLSEAHLIHRSLSRTGQQFPWKLAQEGRRYLAKHELLA